MAGREPKSCSFHEVQFGGVHVLCNFVQHAAIDRLLGVNDRPTYIQQMPYRCVSPMMMMMMMMMMLVLLCCCRATCRSSPAHAST